MFKNSHLDLQEIGLAIAVALIVCAFVIGNRSLRLYDSDALQTTDHNAVITFSQWATIDDLSAALDSNGVQYDEQELKWAARLLGWNRYHPGRYVLDSSSDYDSFLSRLTRGIQDPLKVTILPGIDWERLTKHLGDQFKANSQAFLEASKQQEWLDEQGISRNELLGRMLPNSYEMYWDIAPQRFYERMLSIFNQRITQQYTQRLSELNRNLDEIITLASIIEWEAFDNQEKPKISGLYWNRLRRGMPLQADPTVIFAIGERRRLLYEDYRYDHPYNTYMIRGLPPGPITNPSESSIKAALFPEDHDYYYMVATPDRSHDFSRTFTEHKRKSEQWRRWLRKQYRIKRQQEAQNGS
ncbi:MAG: endolytic transglycosylase MltG [Bacteroidota bacterium]